MLFPSQKATSTEHSLAISSFLLIGAPCKCF
nr:MAG TPA: hypothetical protein [Caudoviricetes sp.]